jgi:hypothetical protein
VVVGDLRAMAVVGNDQTKQTTFAWAGNASVVYWRLWRLHCSSPRPCALLVKPTALTDPTARASPPDGVVFLRRQDRGDQSDHFGWGHGDHEGRCRWYCTSGDMNGCLKTEKAGKTCKSTGAGKPAVARTWRPP